MAARVYSFMNKEAHSGQTSNVHQIQSRIPEASRVSVSTLETHFKRPRT
jgi:hypothetical protein